MGQNTNAQKAIQEEYDSFIESLDRTASLKMPEKGHFSI